MDEPILTARDVFKTYRLGRVRVPVLRGVSLAVDPGEWVAVLGASGSGKSTLLHLLGGLDRPDANPPSTIEYRGRTLASMGARGLDRYRTCEVGFVFQFYHLLPELTVLDNVLVPAMIRAGRLGYTRQRRSLRTRAAALLGELGLAHRIRHRPVELSGGERQRVAIARALINEPAVLLADEPTGNLDAKTGGAILEVLTTLCRAAGLTMVMVTHDARVAARADRIETLIDGRMAPSGPDEGPAEGLGAGEAGVGCASGSGPASSGVDSTADAGGRCAAPDRPDGV